MKDIRAYPLSAWIAVAVMALTGCAPSDSAGPWAGWRGPTGMGLSETTELPAMWSRESENIRWDAELEGHGNSSPIVVDGVVIATSAKTMKRKTGKQIKGYVTAIDLESGERLWMTELPTRPSEKRHFLNSHAAPTPATDGQRIFVYLGSELAALDMAGNILWTQTVDQTYVKYSRYGAASSPVLVDDMVILFQDREFGHNDDIGWLAALSQETGEEIWRVEWIDTCCAYSTPVVRPDSGELIIAHSGTVRGYDPATGEILWAENHKMVQTVPSPVIEGDLLAMTGGGNHNRSTLVVRLTGKRAKTETEVLWEIERKYSAKTASPVLVQGIFYVVTEAGVLVAYEAESGKMLYRERLYGGNYRSSIVYGDGKLYITNEGGMTSVVAATREFDLLAENNLGTGSNASPAVSDSCLLLRSPSRVFCIDKETAPMAGTTSTAG